MSNTVSPVSTPNPVRPLFRQQALSHFGSKQYGTIILVKSWNHRFLTLFAVVIALTIVSFFVFFSSTRKAQSSGVLLPTHGVIKVMANQNGIVIEKRVKEGQVVKAGEVLYVLRSERRGQAGASSQAQAVTTVDAQKAVSVMLQQRRESFGAELKQSGVQSQQRLAALQQRLADLREEVQRSEVQLDLQKQRLNLAEQNWKRFKELQSTQFISAAQLQDRQAELIDQQQRLADLQRLKATHLREVSTTQAELNDARIVAAREQTQCV